MNQSVSKAISLLNLFIDKKELSLQEISDLANMPKPTAYRLLTTLEKEGLLQKMKDSPHDSRYRLGLKLLEYGNLVAERIELREIALPYMEKLSEIVDEAVHLVIANQHEATYIEKVTNERTLNLYTKIGRSIPLYIGSGPKLLLAFLSEEQQSQILRQPNLKTLTNHEIEVEILKRELENIRNQQFAISVGEQDEETTGISFPIFNYNKKVVAALTISGLSNRFTEDRFEFIHENGLRLAGKISQQLGYAPKVIVHN